MTPRLLSLLFNPASPRRTQTLVAKTRSVNIGDHLLQLSEASGGEEEEEGSASRQAFRLVMCNELRDQRMRTDAAQEWATWDRGHCLSLQWSSRGSALYDVSRLENPEVGCWEHCYAGYSEGA